MRSATYWYKLCTIAVLYVRKGYESRRRRCEVVLNDVVEVKEEVRKRVPWSMQGRSARRVYQNVSKATRLNCAGRARGSNSEAARSLSILLASCPKKQSSSVSRGF